MGTGVDVVDLRRFEAIVTRNPRLVQRLFTAEERELPVQSLAGRFAVREAVAKALHAPPGMIWRDCWVEKNHDGAPRLVTTGTVRQTAEKLGVNRWHISISHDGPVAVATAIAERLSPEEIEAARALERAAWEET